jgi:hypothetical protein
MENFRIIHPDIQIISEYHPDLGQYAELSATGLLAGCLGFWLNFKF